MFEIPALSIQQKDVTLLVTALPFGELRKHTRVDEFKPDSPHGYQRPLVVRRLAEIGKYVTQDLGVLPTSILVCIREGDPNPPSFEAQGSVGNFALTGILRIPDEAILWMVDGQHRHYGVNHVYERNGSSELIDYPFPVTIMVGVDQYTEMLHFNTINTQQRKMPTDIVDRHMVVKAEREGARGMIASGKRGEKEFLRARCTRIADALNEKPGPWHHQIEIPGVVGREQGLVRQHAIVASLEPSLKDPWLSDRTDEEVAELLARYWRAIEKSWPLAFDEPANHRVQATVGVYSLNMAFPTVIQSCLSRRDFSEDTMHQIWEGPGFDPKFWNKEEGDPLILGTGMASIRALAHYFRQEIGKANRVLHDPISI